MVAEKRVKEVRSCVMDSLEIRQDDSGASKIVGHAAVFNSLSEPIAGMFYERIKPGAFSRAIKEGQDVRALFNHDSNYVLGRTKSKTLSLEEDSQGLYIEIVPPKTRFAEDLAVSIERGDISQMSFGFIVRSETWLSGAGPNGLDIREVVDVDLFDVSPVTYPAYPDTDVAVRSYQERLNMNADLHFKLRLRKSYL